MAKEQSFDVVSQVDMQEVDNAVQQASKELTQRFDLKNTGSTITLDKTGAAIVVTSASDFVLGQVRDIIGTKLIRRNIDLKAVTWGKVEDATGGTVRVTGQIVNGIETDIARKINKDIKEQKFKAKVQIEGDQLRVFSASRDVLQEIIVFLKAQDYGIPLQFTNYR
ncbi:MAG: YajQ family cyclic di-GMP-binding protein [Coriobacteriia bacterium]|nr:YajQ family cyclic di-GMP-binding protein [Coriobacteriia bacterium]MBN2821860.1 YajQ family cyclic di-GMP-binding protein [Coriobacteriia bacterium]